MKNSITEHAINSAPTYLATILVVVDPRGDSKVALNLAIALAQKFEANLILLRVFNADVSFDTEVHGETIKTFDKTSGDALLEMAHLEVEMRSQWAKCRSAFRIGNFCEQILHEAEDVMASLIVMASHSCGWFDRLLRRGAAERMFRYAGCSVLIGRDQRSTEAGGRQKLS